MLSLSQTPSYIRWKQMMVRCYDATNLRYSDYGGRGIVVCARWHDFENFHADVGEAPKGKSFDRFPDNDGNYEPGNWRWATASEQAFNRRPRLVGGIPVTGTSGKRRGVSWDNRDRKRSAYGKENGKKIRLYNGPSYEEACLRGDAWETRQNARRAGLC